MSSARETAEKIASDWYGKTHPLAKKLADDVAAAILAERSAIATMLEAKATAMRESLSNNIEAAVRTRTEHIMLEGMEVATTACVAAIRARQ